jgi:UDP-GlcNAc:undecaprenyl-phosphate GlcNAc-1-phosphate transferase
MTQTILLIAVLGGLSALATALVCLNADVIGVRFGLVDRPDGIRKLHEKPTPLVGGLAVMLPALIISLFFAGITRTHTYVDTAAVASIVILVLGLMDDRWGLTPLLRLAAFTLATSIALMLEPLFVLHTLRLELFGLNLEVGFAGFSVLVTLVMIVGFVNAANMADGMNGQLLGSILVWTVFLLAYVPPLEGLPYWALLLSSAVALGFNIKGRLFSGSVGAYSASMFVALSAIAVYRNANGAMPAEVPALWFYLPVLDCLRLFAQRMLAGRSPFTADRHHFHHILLRHMRPVQALLVYLALLGAPGFVALYDLHFGSIALVPCVIVYGVLVARNAASGAEIPARQGV